MVKSKRPVETVRAYLTPAEIMAQLAEEAAELAKAALKLRRTYSDANPTPVSTEEAFDNLMEELADVQNCVFALEINHSTDLMKVRRISISKMQRWAERLEESHGQKGT